MRLLFCDLETAGLTDQDTILEVGAIIHDIVENREISRKQMLVRQKIRRQYLPMPRVVYDMHMKSGLLTEIGHELGLCDIQEEIIQMILSAGMSSGECIMAGFSPHFDRRFMRIHLPALEAFLHHRNIDVSTLRELTLAWTGSKPAKIDRHRAIPDCEEAIATLMTYRSQFPKIVIPMPPTFDPTMDPNVKRVGDSGGPIADPNVKAGGSSASKPLDPQDLP